MWREVLVLWTWEGVASWVGSRGRGYTRLEAQVWHARVGVDLVVVVISGGEIICGRVMDGIWDGLGGLYVQDGMCRVDGCEDACGDVC